MVRDVLFWDKKYSKSKIVRILQNTANPRFIEFAALLLSRTNEPKMVFSTYLSKADFCNNWRKIKLRMRKNRWNDNRTIFWDEIYKVVRQSISPNKLIKEPSRELAVDPEIRDLCAKLRLARKDAGMTQGELAKKSRLSQQAISFVEQGYTNVSLGTLKKITDALGLKIALEESVSND